YEKNDDGHYYRKSLPSEFIWRGADGTELLAINMPFWYNNAQRFPDNIEKSLKLLEKIENLFENLAVTPYLLLMNGVDHLEAQDDLIPILNTLNTRLDDKRRVFQFKLEDYVRQVKEYIDKHNIKLTVKAGELREGGDFDLLKGTLSSRIYLKKLNVEAQNRLECHLEPLYSMLELAGMNGIYSLENFQYMWKVLIKNHAHDSICGCSLDNVHKHMEDSYLRLDEVYNEMLNKGMEKAAEHMDIVLYENNNYVIAVANTTEFRQSRLVKVTVDVLKKDNYSGIVITDSDGNLADYSIISRRDAVKDVNSPLNLPGKLDVDRYEVYLYVKDINPLSFKGYIVSKGENQNGLIYNRLESSSKFIMENDYLLVKVYKNGSVDLYDKRQEKWFKNVIDIEDTADRGDSYVYGDSGDNAIKGSDFNAEVSVLENNNMVSCVEIKRDMFVPEHYDFLNRRQSDNKTKCSVNLKLSLEKGSEFLKVSYEIDNTAHDHRMRLLVRTGVEDDSIIADNPFDITCHKDDSHFGATMSKVVSNTSFALLEKDGNGVAVLTEGMHEAEHMPGDKAIALTMVRCTGVINRSYDLSEGGGENWRVPENQCIRMITGGIGILPYTGGYINAGIQKYAKLFRNKPLVYFTSCDTRKFKVGRATVQETDLDDYYYLTDPYEKVKVKDNKSLADINGTGITVSALKKAEGGDGIILRMVNLDEKAQNLTIKVNGVIYQTSMNEKNRDYLCENELNCSLPSKKISTLFINHNKH
ncbi:MAG: glycoside hydrolase family 38 C-terminal domain-containing protein, partial [Eubacteriales bacterium]|nr:glycoside hydrolase family 38 C-terminal domain-containing protein [Eubacteriales bacterium]